MNHDETMQGSRSVASGSSEISIFLVADAWTRRFRSPERGPHAGKVRAKRVESYPGLSMYSVVARVTYEIFIT